MSHPDKSADAFSLIYQSVCLFGLLEGAAAKRCHILNDACTPSAQTRSSPFLIPNRPFPPRVTDEVCAGGQVAFVLKSPLQVASVSRISPLVQLSLCDIFDYFDVSVYI